jgi:hypothetical protein
MSWGGARLAKRGSTSGLGPWRRSARFRQIAREGCRANLAKLGAAPRCGAKRKRDGRPCQNPGMRNGRCDRHGGKTPCGDNWHTTIWPDCSTPAGAKKFNRKLQQLQKRAEERAARLAVMTPERRAKYDAWHRTRPRGAAALRRAARERVRQNAQARLLLTVGPPQPGLGTEAARIEAALHAVRAKLTALEARTAKSSNDDEEDIFS